MLTPEEEATLRRIAAENMPMRKLNPVPSVEKPKGESMEEYFKRASIVPPMKIVSINDDEAVKSALRNAGFSKMSPGEIYAKGISRHAILTSSASDLRRAMAAADERDREQGIASPGSTFLELPAKPKPQQRVFITE